jgi:sulfate transport system permease protein
MAGAVTNFPTTAPLAHHPIKATSEPLFVRVILISVVFLFFSLFLFLPLVVVFKEAFASGIAAFFAVFENDSTAASIKLTFLTAAIAVPLNTAFGICAAWALTRFDFRGRSILITLIDLPLWVSPVVAGLIYVLIFGANGWLGPWFIAHGMPIIYNTPGIILATMFVTFPFVARGLIPLMQAQGAKEEEAALSLGANGWQIFWRVTLPKIKWGLIYGVILCNARAMGEFGAVSVVSGHIDGKTNTMPLHIEFLYNSYRYSAAFAVASVLCILALLTLIIKTFAEWRAEQQLAEALRSPDLPPRR